MKTKKNILMIIVIFISFYCYCQSFTLSKKKIEKKFLKVNDNLLAYKY